MSFNGVIDILLPSPCTAFSQALTINSFGDVTEANGRGTLFRSDHVSRNGLTETKDREKSRN